MTRLAYDDREMSAPIWAWFQNAISQEKSTTSAAPRNAATAGCGPYCTRRQTSCRYKGQLKLKDWAFGIARRSSMRKARIALARRLAIIMHAMLRDGTEFLAA